MSFVVVQWHVEYTSVVGGVTGHQDGVMNTGLPARLNGHHG